MKRKLSGMVLVGGTLAMTASHAAAPRRTLTDVGMLEGSCDRLLAAGVDLSPHCTGKITNNTWSDGRVSFTFLSSQGDLLITFTGVGSSPIKPDADTAIQPVDGLIVTLKQQTSDLRAVGQCRYTNPYKPSAVVVCGADTAEGRYEASFASDGQPPQHMQPNGRRRP